MINVAVAEYEWGLILQIARISNGAGQADQNATTAKLFNDKLGLRPCRFARRTISYQLNANEEAAATHIADHFVPTL